MPAGHTCSLPEQNLLLRGKNYLPPPTPRSKPFPLGADPTEKVDKGTVVEEFLSLKVYPFTLIYCGPTVIDRMSRLISVCLIRICSVYILSYKVPP